MNVAEFFARIAATDRQADVALVEEGRTRSYADLLAHVNSLAEALLALRSRTIASILDNGADWVALDLACLMAGIVHVPIPVFFSPQQLAFVLEQVGADTVVCDALTAQPLAALGFSAKPSSGLGNAQLLRRSVAAVGIHQGTQKITFTSGTTGMPKGVCLGSTQLLTVAEELAAALDPLGLSRHMNALPLPILLENIAGIYAPLLMGATVSVLPLQAVGLRGSSTFDPRAFHLALDGSAAHSVIMLPQMLRVYGEWLDMTTTPPPASLRFMPVGGAAVGAALLAKARKIGLPAYEGYGLSEGASVQTLNLPDADLPGSAGRALPHSHLRVAEDGEVMVSGTVALGYLGQPPVGDAWFATGDLGNIDAAGFLHILGRKKNVLITSFGRNVSPEWVELRLTGSPCIHHAVVFGEAQPSLGAVVWPAPGATDIEVQSAIDEANAALPDYARIGNWMRARAPFSADAELATANGRPRRDRIFSLHHDLFGGERRAALQ
ncbi:MULTISPECIES: AMP-binding protein [unclassified Achromobacter]|uniref:AMP-binding protein n=1 Tax=unclassified Achromobacter TaxID=2626865 RepID=UPI000B51B19C|nr:MULTISPECIES: AMP-binding protein [unclassified Achromobacter]OWT74685.1 long-chain acyl-CoA synthetase [Achromobacter sp. HZ34]OWT79152.1 long-chain acyl-CoA synthetase [Achromobacter sp. HZ28]